jgi:hypothetical protein
MAHGSGRARACEREKSYKERVDPVIGPSLQRSYAAIMKHSSKDNSGGAGISWSHIALGGAFILAGVMLDRICSRRGHKHTEIMLDDALDGTYPASDATATQDFSSPDDRAALKSRAALNS